MVARRESYQAAIDKATHLGTVKTVTLVGVGRWTVGGAHCAYTVRMVDGELHCQCAAGKLDIPCYHAAAVWLRLKGEEAAGRGRGGRDGTCKWCGGRTTVYPARGAEFSWFECGDCRTPRPIETAQSAPLARRRLAVEGDADDISMYDLIRAGRLACDDSRAP